MRGRASSNCPRGPTHSETVPFAQARPPSWKISRVLEESTLPPEILLPGARHSQDVKCLAVGHAFESVPHSPTSFNASDGTQAMDLSQVDANNAV